MDIKREITVPKGEAIRKVSRFLNQLVEKKFPAELNSGGLENKWEGNLLKFNFTLRKGNIYGRVLGTIFLTEKVIEFNIVFPKTITTSIDEILLNEFVEQKFDNFF